MNARTPNTAPSGTSRPVPFKLSSERISDASWVTVEGELDLATSAALANELGRAVSSQSKRVVLDLQEVAFIDCVGVTALAKATDRANARGKHLRIVNPSAQVHRTMGHAGLIPFFLRRGALAA